MARGIIFLDVSSNSFQHLCDIGRDLLTYYILSSSCNLSWTSCFMLCFATVGRYKNLEKKKPTSPIENMIGMSHRRNMSGQPGQLDFFFFHQSFIDVI